MPVRDSKATELRICTLRIVAVGFSVLRET
jgi:hypothetical protein